MNVKITKHNNIEYVRIYVNNNERYDEDIEKEINNYKKKYKKVSVFISGEKPIEDVLTSIIRDF